MPRSGNIIILIAHETNFLGLQQLQGSMYVRQIWFLL